ncbi:hypothetical protein Y032_0032g2618 [Ancylostoma ceylanicum]|uniref:Uncharacterized protein n=1 Tax=Ancylostoma ceylanicum TaxID=53326 RepID=A0A016URA2_9BILA|nr:hypothetical protein Y032_0032g2618 [Ancylostoma ceylanicum]
MTHRVYEYRPTKFRVSFNAALCYGLNHTVLLSFMHHWVDAERIPESLMKQKAFMITKKQKDMEGIIPLARTKFPYSVSATFNGKTVGSGDEDFTMENGHFYVMISKSRTKLLRLDLSATTNSSKGSGNTVRKRLSLTIDMKTPLPRYIALFSTNPQHCPAFISAVDSNFDVWLRDRPIDIEGVTPPRPKNTTILRDVILGCLSILFYYYCLTSFILPAYFNYMMPTNPAQAEQSGVFRTLEVTLRKSLAVLA